MARILLEIRCADPRCVTRGRPSYVEQVPDWLVSGLIVAYHALHEAHALEITVDGVRYRPGHPEHDPESPVERRP